MTPEEQIYDLGQRLRATEDELRMTKLTLKDTQDSLAVASRNLLAFADQHAEARMTPTTPREMIVG